MSDYFIEMTCIYISVLYYAYVMLNFMCLFIIMSIIVGRHSKVFSKLLQKGYEDHQVEVPVVVQTNVKHVPPKM